MDAPLADRPEWFTNAIQTRFEDRMVMVDDCPIHYLLWNGTDRAKPSLIFAHGSGAHAYWWSFIAPFFTNEYRVAAIDLAGMGDSGHRDEYSPESYAKDFMAVKADAKFGRETIIIGHSFGGFVTLKAGCLFGQELTGVVLVDAPVRPPDYEWQRDPDKAPIRPKKIYPNQASALARFRLMPPQPCLNRYIIDFLAEHSVHRQQDGWTWKFDDRLFHKYRPGNMSEDLANLACRVGVIYGENSDLVNQEVVDYMFSVLDESVPFIALPEAQHHVMVDQPLPFVAALRALLAEWRHSRPLRIPKNA